MVFAVSCKPDDHASWATSPGLRTRLLYSLRPSFLLTETFFRTNKHSSGDNIISIHCHACPSHVETNFPCIHAVKFVSLIFILEFWRSHAIVHQIFSHSPCFAPDFLCLQHMNCRCCCQLMVMIRYKLCQTVLAISGQFNGHACGAPNSCFRTWAFCFLGALLLFSKTLSRADKSPPCDYVLRCCPEC
uniref:Uncharacterized protein n=1 Tax=Arundo donax TaxID=35708 RepID=A0A0A8YH46_ARUDO